MFKPQTFLLLLGLAVLGTWFSSTNHWKKDKTIIAGYRSGQHKFSRYSSGKLKEKATEAEKFASINKYNDTVCFLVDMSLPSGQNRFFVYDLKGDSIKNSGLVTHGRCTEDWLEGRKYGNTVGCGCTSLGKYKIGYQYNGRFGLAFKLHGLEKTNDKAFTRYVVLHSHECVPESEISDDICQSDGCPTVSPGFLQKLKPIISESKKPVLLWIYD